MSAHDFNVLLASRGGLALILGLFSSAVKGYISLPLAALVTGVILGPDILGLFVYLEGIDQHFFLEQMARVSMAMGLVGISLRFSRRKLKELWKTAFALIISAMLIMWALSSLVSWLVFSSGTLAALLIGAIITPTDPVVAGSITTGKMSTENLPPRIRLLLSLESGLNDGLAYLFVFLPLLLMKKEISVAFFEWFTRILLWEVSGAAFIGLASGYLIGKAFNHVEEKREIERTDVFIISTTLAICILGAAKLAGTDGILAVFLAGITFSLSIAKDAREELENAQEGMSHLATLPIFLSFGLALPWEGRFSLGWQGVLWSILMLILRRVPALLLIYRFIPGLGSLRDALFMGWFGPIGVSALFYALLSVKETHMQSFWEIGSLMVAVSTLAHGLTAAPYSSWFGRQQK